MLSYVESVFLSPGTLPDRQSPGLFYRPKYALRGSRQGKIIGAEALLLNQSGEFGLMPPRSIIPEFLQHDEVNPKTWKFLESILLQHNQWSRIGVPLKLSFNLTPRILLSNNFNDDLLYRLKKIGGDPADISIEITAGTAMSNSASLSLALSRLRNLGIDSSMHLLSANDYLFQDQQFTPFAELKIDSILANDILTNEKNMAILESLVELGRSQSLSVCVDGVEYPTALKIIEKLGCDSVYGNYFSAPVPADIFEECLVLEAKTNSSNTAKFAAIA